MLISIIIVDYKNLIAYTEGIRTYTGTISVSSVESLHTKDQNYVGNEGATKPIKVHLRKLKDI